MASTAGEGRSPEQRSAAGGAASRRAASAEYGRWAGLARMGSGPVIPMLVERLAGLEQGEFRKRPSMPMDAPSRCRRGRPAHQELTAI
jgi:hypothetical protein